MGKRAWQYPEATGITNDDVILLDSPTGGSRSIKANKIGSVLINKTLTERGTFDATDDNVDGYKKVTVDVPYTDVEVASGPVASWDDGEDLPLKSLTSFIEPQQEGSGDPSPENIRPIIGHTEANVNVSGVNIYDGQWEVGGIRTADGTPVSASAVRSKEYIRVPMGEKLYFFIPATIYIYYYDSAKNYKSYISITNSTVITPPQGTEYVKYQLTGAYGTTYNNDISINYPSTDTSYHAYNGQTYKVEFKDGSNPLTVYGGTLDVVSGVLTVDRVGVDMGDLNWTYANGFFRTLDLNSTIKRPANNYAIVNTISSMYKAESWNAISGTSNGKFAVSTDTSNPLIVCNTDYTDATTFKSAMSGVQLVYELATPLTIQLTPTQVKSLLGTNNVWADTGDVDVEYQKIWVRPSA